MQSWFVKKATVEVLLFVSHHSPSPRISRSTTATVTCVEEAEVRAAALKPGTHNSLTSISPELILHRPRYLYINERAYSRGAVVRDSSVVGRSQAAVLTAQTINCESHFLSHVVLQSFRYVSHLLFHMACRRLTLHHILCLPMGFRKTHLTLECTLSTPATCLQHC